MSYLPPPPPSAMPSDVKSTKEERERATLQQRRPEPTSNIDELHRRLHTDPRFNPPTPSPWKRAALLVFVLGLLYVAMTLRSAMRVKPEPDVIHAQRCVRGRPSYEIAQR